RVDVDALMDEVRRRVADRRASGEYEEWMREPAFAELALHDELAASANRVAAAARLPDVVPGLYPVPPGSIDDSPDERAQEALEAVQAPAGVANRAIGFARHVVRKAVGNRMDQFIRNVEEFFAASSDNARVTAERLIALERRVAELESEKAGKEQA
ncbi:MAG: hypothetical protein DCC49_13600, partial [Acidobacteria bacterium]